MVREILIKMLLGYAIIKIFNCVQSFFKDEIYRSEKIKLWQWYALFIVVCDYLVGDLIFKVYLA
jgi:hypothetical protein